MSFCQPLPAAGRSSVPPHCIIVTGPRHEGKVRWLQEAIHRLRTRQRSVRCAILASEENAAELEILSRAFPDVTLRRLVLPCQCCSAAAGLPHNAQSLSATSGADFLFISLPALAANGLIAEFDALVRWPREIVVCLDSAWADARRAGTLSFFQFRLISAADRVVDTSAPPAREEYPDTGLRRHNGASTPAPAFG